MWKMNNERRCIARSTIVTAVSIYRHLLDVWILFRPHKIWHIREQGQLQQQQKTARNRFIFLSLRFSWIFAVPRVIVYLHNSTRHCIEWCNCANQCNKIQVCMFAFYYPRWHGKFTNHLFINLHAINWNQSLLALKCFEWDTRAQASVRFI